MSKAIAFAHPFLIIEMTDETQKSKWRGRVFRYAPLVLWISIIFLLSSTQGSMTKTSFFIRPLLEFLFPGAAEETLLIYHGYVRKFAHFSEYAILAFWAWRAFRTSANEIIKKYNLLVSVGLVLLVASIDELNQSFNPTRTGSAGDVLLDLAGGAAMILVIYLMSKKRTRV
jgi:VanZ family protein